MKKKYQKPTMEVVNMKYQGILAHSGGLNAPEYYRFFPEEDVEVYE